jgi:hypothetical protein
MFHTTKKNLYYRYNAEVKYDAPDYNRLLMPVGCPATLVRRLHLGLYLEQDTETALEK